MKMKIPVFNQSIPTMDSSFACFMVKGHVKTCLPSGKLVSCRKYPLVI